MNAKEMTNEQILNHFGLDFRIEKLPLFTEFNGEKIETSDFGLLNTKTNEIINTVKNSYRVTQNDEVLDLVMKGIKGFGELNLKMGGSLHGGRKTFYQLEIDGFSKVGNDELKKYITVLDSNDGTTGLSVGIGNLTMSCQNQYRRFYKAGQFKGRHSASIEPMLLELSNLIHMALNENLKFIELMNKFKSSKVSMDLATKMAKYLCGIEKNEIVSTENEALSTRKVNAYNELMKNINHEVKETEKGLNAWGLFSGVTRWTTHDKSSPTRENGRVESFMVGTNYKTNQESLNFLLEETGIENTLLVM